MEQCMEAKAFKSSLGRELAMKSTQHVFIGELWCGDTGISCLPTASDDFSVDDLLDLSNGNFEDNSVEEEEEEEKDTGSVEEYGTSNVSSFTDSTLATQFSVPDDYLAELEWVSHFVDDSVSELSLLQQEPSLTKNRSEPEPKRVESRFPWLPSHIPVKARTKRFRPTGRVRSLWSPPGDSPSITSFLSSPSSSTCSSLSTSYLLVTNRVWNMGGFLGEPAAKRQKMTKPAFENGSEVLVQFQRKCSHCQVQKTPQWRTGPHGPKTLCNACGVRYKLNRLFPEYRPACSPTFSGDVHSNSHRKVLEIRRRKDSGESENRSGLTST